MAAEEATPLTLHELAPAPGSHRERKRVGRGKGSGNGKTSGRGQKGQKSRSGSHRMRAGFEGGQMPIYMRLGKLRGPNHKKSMPLGPFRTHTVPVNLRDLARFDEGVEVTPELLRAAGVVRSRKHPVKVLGQGTLETRLTVRAHAFSARARAAIEEAGGSALLIGADGDHEAASKPRAAASPEPEASAEAPAGEDAPADPDGDAEA